MKEKAARVDEGEAEPELHVAACLRCVINGSRKDLAWKMNTAFLHGSWVFGSEYPSRLSASSSLALR